MVIAYGNSYINDLYLSGQNIAGDIVRAGDETLGTAQLKMTNVAVRNGANGIYIRQSQVSHFTNCTIQTNSGAGVHAETNDGTHKNVMNTFLNCGISSNGVGVNLLNAMNTRLTNCVIQQNNGIGLRAYVDNPNRVRWLRLAGCYFERNGAYNAQYIGTGPLLDDVLLHDTYYAHESGDAGKIQFCNVRGVSFYESIPAGKIEIMDGTHPARRIAVYTHNPDVWPISDEVNS